MSQSYSGRLGRKPPVHRPTTEELDNCLCAECRRKGDLGMLKEQGGACDECKERILTLLFGPREEAN